MEKEKARKKESLTDEVETLVESSRRNKSQLRWLPKPLLAPPASIELFAASSIQFVE